MDTSSDAPDYVSSDVRDRTLEQSTEGQTQPLSQPVEPNSSQRARDFALNRESWGMLISCVQGLPSERFFRHTPEITIGREKSMICLPWNCISMRHAVIRWDPNMNNEITIEDLSANGTWLNGNCIGKGKIRPLREGAELSFGLGRHANKESEPEYRYKFRDLVAEYREVYDKYDFSVQLGKGTYATVYKAISRVTNEWVAIKVIHQSMRPPTDDDTCREIDILKHLVHPNICRMKEHFINPNRSIDLVLEFMDGRDLLHYMNERGGDMTDWMSWHLTLQICQAVAYMHSLSIVHRDLKPENILLSQKQPPIVKIADFGWAKLVDEQMALTSICGTPTYIAPEIVMGEPYTDKVDSWSVGAVVFLMFTRNTPMPRVETMKLKQLIEVEHISWELLQRSHVTQNARDFLEQLLDFNPTRRMDLGDALGHPWLISRDATYPIHQPSDANEDIIAARTVSLPSAKNSRRNIPPVREGTADPFAGADDAMPFDPYAPVDPYGPVVPIGGRNTISERALAAAGSSQAVLEALQVGETDAMTHSQEDEYIYKPRQPAAPPVAGPSAAPKTPQRGGVGGQKRPLADMQGTSSPPPRKKGKTVARTAAPAATAATETKPRAKAPAPRKPKAPPKEAKGKAPAPRKTKAPARKAGAAASQADPDPPETTATRRSTRSTARLARQ